MKAKTELFLYIAAEYVSGWFTYPALSHAFMRPQWNLGPHYPRQLERLRQKALLEAKEAVEAKDRVYRLTETGRAAVAYPDPPSLWNRVWDGKWRIGFFDLPEERRSERAACRRVLRRRRFGCLQGSVWISPDPLLEMRLEGEVRTRRLLFIEGRPAAGETDSEIVAGAWDWERIARLYAQYVKHLDTFPEANADVTDLRSRLPAWIRREYECWREIMFTDPFLPATLLPEHYGGRPVFAARESMLRRARTLVQRLIAP